jgi:hypothetical protein
VIRVEIETVREQAAHPEAQAASAAPVPRGRAPSTEQWSSSALRRCAVLRADRP